MGPSGCGWNDPDTIQRAAMNSIRQFVWKKPICWNSRLRSDDLFVPPMNDAHLKFETQTNLFWGISGLGPERYIRGLRLEHTTNPSGGARSLVAVPIPDHQIKSEDFEGQMYDNLPKQHVIITRDLHKWFVVDQENAYWTAADDMSVATDPDMMLTDERRKKLETFP